VKSVKEGQEKAQKKLVKKLMEGTGRNGRFIKEEVRKNEID